MFTRKIYYNIIIIKIVLVNQICYIYVYHKSNILLSMSFFKVFMKRSEKLISSTGDYALN